MVSPRAESALAPGALGFCIEQIGPAVLEGVKDGTNGRCGIVVFAGDRRDYLDEFAFRFNRRAARHHGLLFYRLLEQAVATDPQPYDTLTAEPAA